MDKYAKILIGIVLLVYLNAAIMFVFNSQDSVNGSDLDIAKNPSNPVLNFESSSDEEKEVKLTKDGHQILEELGKGEIQIQNITFDQENSRIKTVLVSFKTLKILPKDFCWEEKVTENITIEVPDMTGMSIKDIAPEIEDVDLPMDLPEDVKNLDLGSEAKQAGINKGKIVEEVTHFVKKCQSSEEIYLSSIFGMVDIVRNGEALSHYTLSFRREERDGEKHDVLTVEKDIVLPSEPGTYGLRIKIWDKLSGSLVEHYEQFIVK